VCCGKTLLEKVMDVGVRHKSVGNRFHGTIYFPFLAT
jgi:hypothetical protein